MCSLLELCLLSLISSDSVFFIACVDIHPFMFLLPAFFCGIMDSNPGSHRYLYMVDISVDPRHRCSRCSDSFVVSFSCCMFVKLDGDASLASSTFCRSGRFRGRLIRASKAKSVFVLCYDKF